ncbi:cytochrome P450 [Deinococcus sp.]|uniref:cytochrome P450 n=1 Tax=Deinococcus sp. TaxID=47478 RepID=UPI00286E2ADB|nr:cytochrome P450 [Deinococcus sp.]
MTTDRTSPDAPPAGCPFHAPSEHKTTQAAPRPEAEVTLDAHGHYRVHSFEAARQVLRSEGVRQAGFAAEQVGEVPSLGRAPVLYAEGEHHHEMRRSTARYFTPAAVSAYQPMMVRLADGLMARLAREGEANLDDLSLHMAVEVAAQVVGLTSSAWPGLERRVMNFVEGGNDVTPPAVLGGKVLGGRSAASATRGGGKLRAILDQSKVLSFFLIDVKPAIAARRKVPRDDLISHLLTRKYTDLEILTECLTYGTAGMVTTREFISAAAWHLLERPELKNEYLHAPEAERHATLQEILRLEPVVSSLYRRSQQELTVGGMTVPAGSVLSLDVVHANTDPALLGETAQQVCPARDLPRGVQPPVLAFGDGHHRCPGAYLAIRESDVFLRRLLMLDVKVVTPPTVTYNETVKGYELRGFRVGLA